MGIHHCQAGGCSCSCEIDSDDFSGAITVHFSIESGTPSTSSGHAVLGPGDRIRLTAEPMTDGQGIIWTLPVKTASDPAVFDWEVAFTDTSNLLRDKLSISGSSGTIQLWEVVAGVETELTDPITLDDTDFTVYHEVRICWQPGESVTPEAKQVSGLPTRAAGGSWTTPDNILAVDAAVAQYALGPLATSAALFGFGFPWHVPRGSTIDGIEFAIFEADISENGAIDDTAQAVLDGFGPLGSNVAGGTPLPAELTIRDYGGPTSLIGGGITVDQLNDPNFGFSFIYTSTNALDGSAIYVDWVAAIIYYTTPDRLPGHLTMAFVNLEGMSPRTQCVKDLNVFGTGGKAVAVAVESGTWNADDAGLSYLYSATRPDCPACDCTIDEGEPCNTCCDEDFPPAAQMIVDIVGGLTAGCDFCPDIDGPYLLDQVDGCYWYGLFPLSDCDGSGLTPPITLQVTLQLVDDGMGSCFWRAIFLVGDGRFPTDDIRPSASYESASIASDEDCQTSPVTLTLTASNPSTSCGGSWPGTVEIATV